MTGTVPPDPGSLPRPLLISAACGAAGVVLFLVGALTTVIGLFVAGFFAGAVSLGVALYWRAELIAAWHAQRDR